MVVSRSISAVYEMTQPLKFLNSVGLLGSLTLIQLTSAIKTQACRTSHFSLQMTVFLLLFVTLFWTDKSTTH